MCILLLCLGGRNVFVIVSERKECTCYCVWGERNVHVVTVPGMKGFTWCHCVSEEGMYCYRERKECACCFCARGEGMCLFFLQLGGKNVRVVTVLVFVPVKNFVQKSRLSEVYRRSAGQVSPHFLWDVNIH
jgi:hypothetical protein